MSATSARSRPNAAESLRLIDARVITLCSVVPGRT
jgi:hypothetical protein